MTKAQRKQPRDIVHMCCVILGIPLNGGLLDHSPAHSPFKCPLGGCRLSSFSWATTRSIPGLGMVRASCQVPDRRERLSFTLKCAANYKLY